MENIIKEKLDKAYAESWYTIIGCAEEDMEKYKEFYKTELLKKDIGEIREWAVITGKEMNEYSNLTGLNAYKDDLHCLAFSLDGLDIGKLAMVKITLRDRWFDDIVDNDRRREQNIDENEDEN